MQLFKYYNLLPSALRHLFEKTPFHYFRWQYARSVKNAFTAGPPYHPSPRRIIIDITETCNLRCVDCSRSCGQGQAPSNAHMNPEQIVHFIRESIAQDRKWEKIQIEGGEPTLHPEFLEIINILINYVKRYTPGTILQVNSNGYSHTSREILNSLPGRVIVYCSAKIQPRQDEHLPFNLAPIDSAQLSKYDFGEGCYLPALYGLGLNRYGYYPHPNCGGIDRVFGFDIGRKSLPRPEDRLEEQYPLLCRYCGLFRYFNRAAVLAIQSVGNETAENKALQGEKPEAISESWVRAYNDYSAVQPVLSEY